MFHSPMATRDTRAVQATHTRFAVRVAREIRVGGVCTSCGAIWCGTCARCELA